MLKLIRRIVCRFRFRNGVVWASLFFICQTLTFVLSFRNDPRQYYFIPICSALLGTRCQTPKRLGPTSISKRSPRFVCRISLIFSFSVLDVSVFAPHRHLVFNLILPSLFRLKEKFLSDR